MEITTSINKKLSKMEAIRGFAAVYVVLHHSFSKGLFFAGKDISVIFQFGQEAVILFFILSGFVIQYAYTLSKDKSFKTFFLKRSLRIYIPLILVFIANYLIVAYQNNSFFTISIYTLIGNILMLQDLWSIKPNVICPTFMGNFPLWSLSYEWWFYMGFFFLVSYVKGSTERISIILYSISIVAALTYLFYPNFVNRELMYFAIWWIGADIAKLYLNKTEISFGSLKMQLAILILITFILFINIKLQRNNIATIGMSPFLELRHFSFSIIVIVGAVLWLKLKWLGFNKTLGLFESIAPISFGIYISHWFLIADAHYLDKQIANPFLRFFGYIIVCIIFSYFIERIIYPSLSKLILERINCRVKPILANRET